MRRHLIPSLMIGSIVALVAYANWRDARRVDPPPMPAIGQPGGPATTRESLHSTIVTLRARLKADPLDANAAVVLADALMRQARVTGNAGLAREADAALERVLRARPDDYTALRMRGAVALSAHRFNDAIEIARRAITLRPRDEWNHGVLGDAHLELGEYAAAFDAFDRMAKMRPSAAAYARVAYARELQGHLDGALDAMRLAADATPPNDPESQAWHFAQLGSIYLERTALDLAEREFQRAQFTFPDHPFALTGLARVAIARGDDRRAIEWLERAQRSSPTGPTAAAAAELGDLHAAAGRHADAERQFAIAESVWRFDAPEPAKLALFLADHEKKIDDALAIAESAARDKGDIFSMDALAWARFKASRGAGGSGSGGGSGRKRSDLLLSADEAMQQALRTGSHDRRIRYHAAAIALALGKIDAARTHARIAVAGDLRFDVRLAADAAALMAGIEARERVARR